jgi:hypothetical protein
VVREIGRARRGRSSSIGPVRYVAIGDGRTTSALWVEGGCESGSVAPPVVEIGRYSSVD